MAEHCFVVGGQRCGTTYLYRMLDGHPEIEMAKPLRPEPKFFMDECLYRRGLPWYEEMFFSQDRIGVRGEKSTSYIESETAAARIRESYPEAKIIMIFRDPVERAVSNYWFSVQNGIEDLPMEEAFRREEERRLHWDDGRYSVCPFSYLQRGRYIDYLEMWRNHFPAQNIRVLVFERLVGSLEAVRSVYEFLGVGPSFAPLALRERVNARQEGNELVQPEVRDFLHEWFMESTCRLAETLGDPLPEWNWR